MPSFLEVFAKALPDMEQAPSPAYLCILLLGLQTTFLCKQPVVAMTLPVLKRAERSLVHLNVWNHSSCFYSIYSVKQCLYLQYLAFI